MNDTTIFLGVCLLCGMSVTFVVSAHLHTRALAVEFRKALREVRASTREAERLTHWRQAVCQAWQRSLVPTRMEGTEGTGTHEASAMAELYRLLQLGCEEAFANSDSLSD